MRGIDTRHAATRSLIVIAVLAVAATPALAQQCIQYVPPLLHDTSGNPDAVPSNPRIHGVETFRWDGAPWLAANNGNNLIMWDVTSPLNPTTRRESNLKGGLCGDRDYNLFNFSLCDDCRYGVAAFPSCPNFTLGAVLFDMGTGVSPFFGDKAQYQTAKARGALTFKHNGQQYLLINGVPNDGSLTPPIYLHLFNGVNSVDLPKLYKVDAAGHDFLLDGGIYFTRGSRSFVYLFEPLPQFKVHIYEVSGSGSNLVLDYKGAPIVAGYVYSKGLRVDVAGGFAAAGRGANLEVWDLTDPATPLLMHTWVPEVGRQITSVAIAYPFLWAAEKGSPDAVWTYDITNPYSPVALDQAFWDPAEPWNAYDYMVEYDGQFGPGGTTLYDGRYSVMEMFDFSACGDVVPVANMTLSPQPAFPGDQLTVTNTSVGAWTRAAVWITLGSDPQGQLVAGSLTLSATTPTALSFTIPAALGLDQSYTAHVAVENDDHPFSFSAPGDQLESVAVSIDRSPTVGITTSPEAILTGETLTLTAEPVEGSPTGYLWTISPPLGQSSEASGQSTQVLLDQSGTWTFDLQAFYQHTATGGGLYQATATQQFTVTSVAAAFDVTPPNPLNTQAITLDGSASRGPVGIALGYDWNVTGATSYTGCPDAVQCVIPAETLNPGQHQIVLTVTNTQNQETSVAVENVNVADGTINPDFSWIPTSPLIGQSTLFTISGVTGEIEQATWNFGGPGCTGFTQTTVCTPSLFNDCRSASYQFASGGSKTVSLTVRVGGQNFQATPKTITVQNTGTCSGGGGCSYTVRSTTTSFSASGGTGTASVTATAGCQWTATDTASWITIQNGSGTGSGNFGFTVASNSGSARSANIVVENQTLPITQAGVGGSADFSISDANPDIGEAVVFTVVGSSTPKSWDLGGESCDSSTTTVSCIFNPNLCKQITWRFASAGTKSVTYTDEANNQVVKTVTVRSVGSCPTPCDATSAPPATFTLSEATVLVGEPLTFTYSGPVKASSIEGFALGEAQAQTLALGITASPSSPQIGQQVLFLLSEVNGTIQQANWNFGGDGCGGEPSTGTCTPSLFNDCKAMAFKYASAGQKSVSVSLSTTGGSQNASTTVTVQNTGTCGGGTTCSYSISPSNASYGSEGGTGLVNVNSQEGCAWTGVSNDSWIQVTSGATGTGPGQVEFTVAENTGASRSGSLRIAGKTFSVNQAGIAAGGGDEAETWEWTVTLNSVVVAESSSPVFTYAFDQPGTYTVRLQVANCLGSAAASKTFTVIQINDYVVPAAAHADGQFDTTWKTDLRLFNPGTTAVTVTLDFLQEARNNAGVIPGVTFDLPPKGTVIIDDVLTVIPGIPLDGSKGSLRFGFEGGGVTPVIMSRTYNDTPDGTYGQYVPAVPVVPGNGEALYLTGLAHNGDFRSNLGVANLSGHDIGGLMATVLDADGNELGSYGIGVPAYSSIQVVNIAAVAGVVGDLDLFTVRLDTNDSDVTAYASMIDNRTGDPVLFTPAIVKGVKSYLVGVAHAFGQNDSVWRSDVTFFNRHAGMSEVRIEYFPDVPSQFRPHLTIPLMPGAAKSFGDILTSLVTDDNTKGYLALEVTGEGQSPQLAARTYNQALSGTFGQTVPVFGEDELIPEGGMGILAGLTNSADRGRGYRTNLGMLNSSTTAQAKVDVTLYDEDGEVVGKIPGYPLEPGQYVQFDIFQGLQLGSFDMDASIELKVLEGGPVAAYASIIDNKTQDPIFIPALPAR